MDKVGVGFIGSGFIAEIHAEAFRSVPNAEVVAVASPNNAAAFAARHSIPRHFADYHDLLALPEVDVVMLLLPNVYHCAACCDAAAAKKHVICEKPLCPTLAEADRMIAACRDNGVHLMYAEELCFTPKYVRAKQVCDEGALGQLYMMKQCEKHDGPHMPWFWDVEKSGGGVTLDMGCHAFEYFRWMLGKERAVSVYADMGTFVHADKTRGDDNSIIIVVFENGCRGVAEESWAKPGGMDDRIELYGSEGVIHCDLLRGSAFETYSKRGLRLRRGEGRQHGGLELHDVRGELELRLPAGGPAFRERGAGAGGTVGDRGGRARGPGDHLRRLRKRGDGQEGAVAVQAAGGEEAD